MNKEEKINLVERLVKENHISFKEGLALLETEKEIVYYPNMLTYPVYPSYPNYLKDHVYCGTSSDVPLEDASNSYVAKPQSKHFVTNYLLARYQN